jgi:hypothetical protein
MWQMTYGFISLLRKQLQRVSQSARDSKIVRHFAVERVLGGFPEHPLAVSA